MTQEIIQMARDSGMELYGLGKDRARFVHHLEAFAKLVAEAERERIKQDNAPEIEKINAYIEHAMQEVQRLGQEIEQEPVACKTLCELCVKRGYTFCANAVKTTPIHSPPQPERHELQAKGEHPAPCARHCEANAFQIVIKNLKAQLAQPEQEPVAWVSEDVCKGQYIDGRPRKIWWECEKGVGTAFYTTPPQRTEQSRACVYCGQLVVKEKNT